MNTRTSLLPWAGPARLLPSLIFTLLALGGALPGTGPAGAAEIKQLKLTVNQLKGATLPNLEDRQKAMNKILEQCDKHGTRIRVTIVKGRENADPMDGGSSIAPDGKVCGDDATRKLIKDGEANEAKTDGIAVWVAKDLKDDAGDSYNGGAIKCRFSIVIKQQDGINGDENTWTHEMAHSLGLGHEHGADGNVLYPYRKKGDGTASGNDLTKAQCEALLPKLCKRNPTTTQTKEDEGQPVKKQLASLIVDTHDDAPVAGTPADIDALHVVFDDLLFPSALPLMEVTMALDAPPSLSQPALYCCFIDTDNNPATGDLNGYDMEVRCQTFGSNGFAFLQPLPIGPPQSLPPPMVTPEPVQYGGETNTITGVTQTLIKVSVPLASLPPLTQTVRVMGMAQAGPFLDQVGPEPVLTRPPPSPFINLNPRETFPGRPVTLQSSGFVPGLPYRILCGDVRVGQGIAAPDGSIVTTFIVPALEPADHVVDVIQDGGAVQIKALRVHDPIGLSIRRNGLSMELSFLTILDVTYLVESKSDLGAPGWDPVTTVTGDGERVTRTVPIDSPRKFFRYRIQ